MALGGVSGTGRGFFRPVLVGAAAVVIAGVAIATVRSRDDDGRPPIAVSNAGAPAVMESVVAGVRHLYRRDAPLRIVPDTSWPREAARLLWFQGRPTAPSEQAVLVVDGGGGIVAFDDRLRPRRLPVALNGRAAATVAPRGDGGLWVATAEGEVLRIGPDGAPHRAAQPFDYSAVVADPEGGAWLTRSTQTFAYRLASPNDPLAVHLTDDGDIGGFLGNIVVPDQTPLAELGNAGHLAVWRNQVFFAPFIRDEIVAFARAGDTLWIAHRGLPQAVEEPRFEMTSAGVVIDYAPVNLGVAMGPDERLYVLSVAGASVTETRLDVFDPRTGVLERSVGLSSPTPTIAVTHRGRVHVLDGFKLLTGVAPDERAPLSPFDLEQLNGGRLTNAALRGKVTLINFWASWCGPCREEMPALDSLRRSVGDSAFQFLTMNEDVNADDAREFLDEFGFDFPVLLGRGQLRRTFHYVGLPFTVLVDREGRVAERWVGFAGPSQIAAIAGLVAAELARERDAPRDHRH